MIMAGWVALPAVILEKQDALGLEPMDLNIILQIAKHWWDATNLPHPSKATIARALQCDPRTVQRRIAALEAAGFIRRIERRGPRGSRGSQTSQYDLSGLVKAATPYAIEALKQREEVRQKQLARLRRKKVLLVEEGGNTPG